MNEKIEKYLNGIKNTIRKKDRQEPINLLFENGTRKEYDGLVEELKFNNYKIIDINKYFEISESDYNIALKDVGLVCNDNSKISDLLFEKDKISLIKKYKSKKLVDEIENGTFLLINYDDLFLKNSPYYYADDDTNCLYEEIRTWLKDFNFIKKKALIIGLIYLEKNDDVNDFCPYGYKAC